jgi:hypothetical protein
MPVMSAVMVPLFTAELSAGWRYRCSVGLLSFMEVTATDFTAVLSSPARRRLSGCRPPL